MKNITSCFAAAPAFCPPLPGDAPIHIKMGAMKNFALSFMLGMGAVISTPVCATLFYTEASITGAFPTSTDSDGWRSSAVQSNASTSDGSSYLNVGAYARAPSSSLPVSLENQGVLYFNNNQVVGPGPYVANLAVGSMKSALTGNFSIGSYTASLGSPVDGILRVDLSSNYSNYSGVEPTLFRAFGNEFFLDFGQKVILALRSSIAATLFNYQDGNAYSGSTSIGTLELFQSGSGVSVVLEIPFSVMVGDTIRLDTELTTDFQAFGSTAFVYSSLIGFTASDPITIDLLTPGAYYASIDGSEGYFGADKLVNATVPEPASLALLAIGLTGLGVIRRRAKHVIRGQTIMALG